MRTTLFLASTALMFAACDGDDMDTDDTEGTELLGQEPPAGTEPVLDATEGGHPRSLGSPPSAAPSERISRP